MEQRDELVALGAVELARRISDGQISAAVATDDYIARLEALHKRCNVLTCERFDDARREALAADARQSKGEWLGPLHGVPVTVKDCFHVTGLPTALGIDGRNAVADDDAVLVRKLRAAGAILLAKTNVSQAMAVLESANPRHGRTLHPTNVLRSPGGSSGGEAVVVAGGGSALGLGSDLAGSIRIPAGFCGVCALKPTGYVLDTHGMDQVFPFSLPIPTSPGPLARRVEDLAVAFDALRSGSCSEQAVPTNGHDSMLVGPLSMRFAVWTDDGYFPTSPAVRQSVEATAHVLSQLGWTRVELPMVDFRKVIMRQVSVMLADGGELLREFVGNGVRDPLIQETLRLASLPSLARMLAVGVARARKRDYFADLAQASGRKTVAELWKIANEIDQMRSDFRCSWRQQKLDFLLTPTFPLPALPHGAARDSASACGFAFLANVMDVPAGVVPVGTMPAHGESARASNYGTAPAWAQSAIIGAEGLPITVQVIGDRFCESTVLTVMRTIESHADWIKGIHDTAVPEQTTRG